MRLFPTLSPGQASQGYSDTNKYVTYKTLKGETVYSLTHKFNISEKAAAQLQSFHCAGILKEDRLLLLAKNLNAGIRTKGKYRPRKPLRKTKHLRLWILAFKPPSKPKKPAYNIGLILPFRLIHP